MKPSALVLCAALLLGALLLGACGSPGAELLAVEQISANETIPEMLPGDTTAALATLPPEAGVDVPVKVDVPLNSARFDAKADTELAPAPVSLRIEAIGIEAPIVPVGVEADNELEVPGASEVGWYKFGPRPGESQGSAVLAAHVDYNGRPGVFFELRSLTTSDDLEVEFEDGTVRRFEIVSLDQYAKDELPFERVFARSGEPLLTLITCGGDFDPAARSYDDNVVVYAVPVT